MRYHKLAFDSGEATCAKFCEDGTVVMCPMVGTIRFGTVWVCRRFATEDQAYTILERRSRCGGDDECGCLQRCSECLKSEVTE
jgi:hypothetical protein